MYAYFCVITATIPLRDRAQNWVDLHDQRRGDLQGSFGPGRIRTG